MRLSHFFKSLGCGAFSLSCGAAVLIAFAPISPARAGFLEELFGAEETPQAAPPPRARPAKKSSGAGFSIRLNEGRKAAAKTAPQDADGGRRDYVAGSRPLKPRLCTVASRSEPTERQSADYLRDETLRSGDSVVTDGDIIVFKGRSACPHTAGDFVPLARSSLPRAQRNALADLERAMKSPARRFEAAREPAAKIVGQVNSAP
jgi:hypothetical protein